MIYLSAVGTINALGNHLDVIARHLKEGSASGLQKKAHWLLNGQTTWLGLVEEKLPLIDSALPSHHTRNNQLLLAALNQIREPVEAALKRFGSHRVAIILGTSTSGLDEADQHIQAVLVGKKTSKPYYYSQQELGDPSAFLSAYLKTTGPAYTVSTACTSSARAIISGRRLIEAGLVDAALVGGADTLCRMPINGFDSLSALSKECCQPFATQRDGINIGEGAALMLLTRTPAPVALLGVGESSDAWHMSAPHPEGKGAIDAIQRALDDAQLTTDDIGYINLHGTATPQNDQVEANVIAQLFGDSVPCSSTKPLTGHALGAASAIEAALCWLILTRSLPLPVQHFDRSALDPTLPSFGLLTKPAALTKKVILSNSFAFGGNNACLILGSHHE